MRDEGFYQFAAGTLDGLSTAEMGGVFLNEDRIEVVLADQKAESVAKKRLAISVSVAACAGGLRPVRRARLGWRRRPTELLDRAEADSVSLAESAIDGAGFSNAHLGAANDSGGV